MTDLETMLANSFAIVARAENGVIGDGAQIPWRSRADMAHFRNATMGMAVVMGRRTFDSLPGALPGRTVIVVTSSHVEDDVHAASSLDKTVGIALGLGIPGIAFAGGLRIYHEALRTPWMKRLLLTEITCTPRGDVILPPIGAEWQATGRTALPRLTGEPHAVVVDYRRGS